MNWILYQIRLLLETRLSWLTALAEQKSQGRRFCVSAFFFFFSEWDVVHRCSQLSLCIPWCHIQPIFTGDRPWRVQSSTASEHVASWWRGGGCGIREKGNVQKHRLACPLVSHTLWHPSHAAGTLKQVVKPPPTERANLLWNAFVYF